LETLQYYEIPEVEVDDYDPAADPHGFTLGDLKEARKIRQQKEDKMLQQRPNLYSFLLSSISDESVDAIKQLEDFSEFHLEKDPLSLWNAILSVHRLQEHSYDENMVKFDSRRQLRTCTQDRHESLVRFFERFSETLQYYNDAGNPEMEDADIALDFLNALDVERYGAFKADYLNQSAWNEAIKASNLNDMYLMAAKYKVPKETRITSQHTAFKTRGYHKQNKKNHFNQNSNQFAQTQSNLNPRAPSFNAFPAKE
jgi:hypothetical protein